MSNCRERGSGPGCGSYLEGQLVIGTRWPAYNNRIAEKELITLSDSEIAALDQARAVLAGGSGPVARKAGRPPKTENRSAAETRIGAAVKRYWAAQKKAAK